MTNNGTNAATGLSLSDLTPEGTTFTSFTAPSGWTATTPAAGGTGIDFRDECDPGPECDRNLLAGGSSQFQRGRSGNDHEFSLSHPDEHGLEFRK